MDPSLLHPFAGETGCFDLCLIVSQRDRHIDQGRNRKREREPDGQATRQRPMHKQRERDNQTDKQPDKQTDTQTGKNDDHSLLPHPFEGDWRCLPLCPSVSHRDRHSPDQGGDKERRTDGVNQTNKQPDKPTDTHTDRHTYGLSEGQTQRPRQKQ